MKNIKETDEIDFCSTGEKGEGFTLLEILLVVALIALVAGIGLPVFGQMQTRNDLELTSQTVIGSLRQAQTYSRGVKNDSTWGVYIDSSAVVVFEGSSYATRNSASDESVDYPGHISASGQTEIVYSKLNGLPQQTGDITLSSSNTDYEKNITINAKGMLQY